MSRIRGRVGKGGNLGAISSMDAFNYNMLGILKTKEERLGMMERMSMIQESLPASMTAPEPELQMHELRLGRRVLHLPDDCRSACPGPCMQGGR